MKVVKRPRSQVPSEREVINTEYPVQPNSIRINLPYARRAVLINLLKKYNHVFAWAPTNMVRVDRKVLEHRLNIKARAKEVKKCEFKEKTKTEQSMSR